MEGEGGDRTHGDTTVRAKLDKWISQIRPPLEGGHEVRHTQKTAYYSVLREFVESSGYGWVEYEDLLVIVSTADYRDKA